MRKYVITPNGICFIISFFSNGTGSPQREDGEGEYTSVQVVTALAMAAGIWQIIFYFLRLSSFCSLLSHSLIRGFTTGAAIHVFSSQVSLNKV